MKLYLLAATALVAAPLYAQTSGSAGTNSPVTNTGPKAPSQADDTATSQTTDPANTGTTNTMDPSATGTAGSTMQSTDNSTMMQGQTGATGTTTGSGTMSTTPDASMGGSTMGGSTMGSTGYAAAAPTGGMMGGAGIPPQPITAPEQSANRDLPVCKAGQYDDCIQRGASRRRR